MDSFVRKGSEESEEMDDPVDKGKVLIKIIFINDIPYVWDASEYVLLRKEYRICGTLDGISPKGTLDKTLPARLTRYEALYLVKHGIALAFQIPSLSDPIPSVSSNLVQELKSQRRMEQIEAYKKRRRREIESTIDKIIEGKRRKLQGRGPIPDRDTVIEEEMQKAALPYELTQIDIADPWIKDSDFIPFDVPMPIEQLDKLRFKVFEDFHLRRKYFIGTGLKFGGDFLAYPGDPKHTHSQFIILCHDTTRSPLPLHVGSLIRLAITVKKILLVAIYDQNKDCIKYKPMNTLNLNPSIKQLKGRRAKKFAENEKDDDNNINNDVKMQA